LPVSSSSNGHFHPFPTNKMRLVVKNEDDDDDDDDDHDAINRLNEKRIMVKTFVVRASERANALVPPRRDAMRCEGREGTRSKDWIGLDWIGLDWIGLDRHRCSLGSIGFFFAARRTRLTDFD
jgi:hypothetical protein